MTVYVDEQRKWPTKIRCFVAGSCHMTADSLDELHAFAKRLALKRSWFQEHRLLPHYDLTIGKRAFALRLGAVFMPAKDQLRAKMRRLPSWCGNPKHSHEPHIDNGECGGF